MLVMLIELIDTDTELPRFAYTMDICHFIDIFFEWRWVSGVVYGSELHVHVHYSILRMNPIWEVPKDYAF